MSNPLTKELDVPAIAAPHLMPPPLPTAADVRREQGRDNQRIKKNSVLFISRST
jgi:hypothetical protein